MSEGAVESAPDTGEESSAEQMLEQAVAEPADELDDTSGEQQDQPEPSRPAPGPNGFPLNTPVAQMTTEEREAYWKYNARKWEKDAKANSEAAKRWAEFEDSQKSELQRLQERAEAAERERDEERRARARLMAAAAHNLPTDLLDRLGGSTEEEISETAEALSREIDAEVERRLPGLVEAEVAKRVEAEVERRLAEHQQRDPSPLGRRPVESLTPGAMPASAPPADGNAFLRRMAGRDA
jgi:hypothetical protein